MRLDGTFIKVAERGKDGESEIGSEQGTGQESSHFPTAVRTSTMATPSARHLVKRVKKICTHFDG